MSLDAELNKLKDLIKTFPEAHRDTCPHISDGAIVYSVGETLYSEDFDPVYDIVMVASELRGYVKDLRDRNFAVYYNETFSNPPGYSAVAELSLSIEMRNEEC